MLFWKCGKGGKGASRSLNSQHTSTAHTPPSHTRTSVKPSSSFQACSRAPRRAALSLRQVQREQIAILSRTTSARGGVVRKVDLKIDYTAVMGSVPTGSPCYPDPCSATAWLWADWVLVDVRWEFCSTSTNEQRLSTSNKGQIALI